MEGSSERRVSSMAGTATENFTLGLDALSLNEEEEIDSCDEDVNSSKEIGDSESNEHSKMTETESSDSEGDEEDITTSENEYEESDKEEMGSFEDKMGEWASDNDNPIDEGVVGDNGEQYILIEGVNDFGNIDWDGLTIEDVMRFRFPNLKVAYSFYNWYGKMKGFSARKSKKLRNKEKKVIQQTFLCHREGFREGKYVKKQDPKRRSKRESRCGCRAKMKVHIDYESKLWEVTYFVDDHNHKMVEDLYVGMLARHRKIHDDDIMQLNMMRKAGMSTIDIFNTFASQVGGYHKLDFRKQDIENLFHKVRKMQRSDADAALKYLSWLRKTDSALFCSYTTDNENRLQHLFWCDGVCQIDYQVFGDVLAFDATYGKNKYFFPLIVFSGVNHHNKTTVFAFALVADETEDTYVWVLEQFLEAMKGKHPISIVTDGDKAMKNAIKKVFPNANHRLCAWHLLRNATSNIGKKRFTIRLRRLMFGDYDVGEFNDKWNEMVKKFGVEQHRWVLDMYDKRELWSFTYLRGKFFAGFRTTSRCEGLHSQIVKYVHSRYNLHEFLQHLNRCLWRIRYVELEANFASEFGDVVLTTRLPALERHASLVFTENIFFKFRERIIRACGLIVKECKDNHMYQIFKVSPRHGEGKVRHVSFYFSSYDAKCSCLLMESYGIPCEHIVAVLVYLNIDELPPSLVLSRWSKKSKDGLQWLNLVEGGSWESKTMVQYFSLLDFCRTMCNLACRKTEHYKATRESIRNIIQFLRAENGIEPDYCTENENDKSGSSFVKDPPRVRYKGCGNYVVSRKGKQKRITRCSLCRGVGHNHKTCQLQVQSDDGEEEDSNMQENAEQSLETSCFGDDDVHGGSPSSSN